jgi:hypothetical protein
LRKNEFLKRMPVSSQKGSRQAWEGPERDSRSHAHDNRHFCEDNYH